MVTDTVLVYAWNQRTGKVTDVLTGHNGPVCGVDFHPGESIPFVEEISSESDPIPSYRGLENFQISSIVSRLTRRGRYRRCDGRWRAS